MSAYSSINNLSRGAIALIGTRAPMPRRSPAPGNCVRFREVCHQPWDGACWPRVGSKSPPSSNRKTTVPANCYGSACVTWVSPALTPAAEDLLEIQDFWKPKQSADRNAAAGTVPNAMGLHHGPIGPDSSCSEPAVPCGSGPVAISNMQAMVAIQMRIGTARPFLMPLVPPGSQLRP